MRILLLAIVILTSCGGSLSDEQRKRLREGMENSKIHRVTDAEIVSASLTYGQQIYSAIENKLFNTAAIDSIENKYGARIGWITPGQQNGSELDGQLVEAYVAGIATGNIQDNVQKMWTPDQQDYDSLVYSKPIVHKRPDGTEELEGIWNIYFSRKKIVLDLSRKK